MRKKKTLVIFSILFSVMLVMVTVTFAASSSTFENKIMSQNDANLTPIAGIVRKVPNGDWFVQKDIDHEPIGFSSVSIENNKIKIVYDQQAKKVVSLIMTPDDALAQRGYIVSGAGVGLGSAEFSVGRLMNVYGGVAYDVNSNNWWLGYNNKEYNISFEDRGNGTLRVYHGDSFGLIPTQLTARDGGYTPKLVLFAPDYFEVSFYDEVGNKVTQFDQRCNFLFTRTGYTLVDLETEQFLDGENFWINGLMIIE